jgi:hypothetical protein
MWSGVDRLGPMLLDASLSAAVLLGLVAMAMVGCRQPARRCCLARAAILGALTLLPLIALWPDRRRIDVGRPIQLVLSAGAPAGAEGSGAAIASAQRSGGGPLSGRLVWPRALRGWGPRLVLLAYGAGVALGLGWLALGGFGSVWLTSQALEPSAATLAFYRSLPYRSGIGRRPRLKVSPVLKRPVLLGLLRPTILIPPELDQPEASDRLRLSLLHELVHAEHADPWFGMAANLAQALWFFLPWLWWIGRQMRLDQEFLADRRAATGFGPPGRYATSLVDLADAKVDPPARRGPAGDTPRAPVARPLFLGAGSALFQRVLMLLRCPYPVESRAPLWWRGLLVPAVACGTWLSASLTLRGVAASPTRPSMRSLDPSSPRQFQLTRLVVAESPAGPHGETEPYNLPLPLPEQFELTLDLYTIPADLAATRVAGYRLGAPPDAHTNAPGWHHVRLKRTRAGVSLAVDGQPVPNPAKTCHPSPWLSIQPPPDRRGIIKNLILSW